VSKNLNGLMRVAEYAAAEKISRVRVYQLLELGLPQARIGHTRLVRVPEATAWRAERAARVGRPRHS